MRKLRETYEKDEWYMSLGAPFLIGAWREEINATQEYVHNLGERCTQAMTSKGKFKDEFERRFKLCYVETEFLVRKRVLILEPPAQTQGVEDTESTAESNEDSLNGDLRRWSLDVYKKTRDGK